ncbi:MAG TPA: hypothetical protein VJL34_06330 [Anaerolineales bacterium]|nr:hypothetical protein [Anaerolineales bacterium]
MEVLIGKVVHFYNRINVAVLDLNDELTMGDTIHIVGRVTDFTQTAESIEIEHQKVRSAGPGEVALKVWDYVRRGDEVYKVQ